MSNDCVGSPDLIRAGADANALPPDHASMRRRATIASTLGNALEWFDYVVYGLLSATIAKLYFPADNPATSALLGFATFGISFGVRPLGGLVFGIYADRYGRKKALTLIFGLMAAGTLTIALLPTYAAIGIAAPITLVLARMIQGFSAGGEFANATATLIEFAPSSKRGLYGSLQMVSQIFATVLAALAVVLITKLLSESALMSWGWRVPFLLGALVGPVGVYLRRRLVESPEFRAEIKRTGHLPSTPFRDVVTLYRGELFASFCLVAALAAPNYVNTVYLPSVAIMEMGIPQANAYLTVMLASCLMMILVPFAGWISDRVQRTRVIAGGLLAIAVIYPVLYARFIELHTFASLLHLQLGCAFAFAFVVGPAAAQAVEIFPVGVRSTGLSLAYNFAVMLFGGLAPLTLAWFRSTTQALYGPVYYLLGIAIVGLIGMRFVSLSGQRRHGQRVGLGEVRVGYGKPGYEA